MSSLLNKNSRIVSGNPVSQRVIIGCFQSCNERSGQFVISAPIKVYLSSDPHSAMLPPEINYLFPGKLWKILSKKNETVKWNAEGDGVLINTKGLLDFLNNDNIFFRPIKPASFLRQMNIYGFGKMPRQDIIGMTAFSNSLFHRDRPELLPRIIRLYPGRVSSQDELILEPSPMDSQSKMDQCRQELDTILGNQIINYLSKRKQIVDQQGAVSQETRTITPATKGPEITHRTSSLLIDSIPITSHNMFADFMKFYPNSAQKVSCDHIGTMGNESDPLWFDPCTSLFK